jgi:hypothetical protein
MLTDWHARARGVTGVRSDGWVRCFSQNRHGSYVSVCVCPGTSIRAGDLLLNCEDISNLTGQSAPTVVAVFFRISTNAAG